MARRLLVIANPASGSPPRPHFGEQALELLRGGGAELVVEVAMRRGHARAIASSANLAGLDALCAVGGDGTAFEIASGLLERSAGPIPPLGLIPTGTGNSLARSLGIETVPDAVQRVLAASPRPLDAVRVIASEQRYCCLNLIGWAAGCAINATAERLRWLGRGRYAAAALAHVLTARPQRGKIALDACTVEDDFLLVLACNTRFAGSGMLAAPRAVIDDGLLDVVLVRRASRWRMLELLRRVHDGSHVAMPEVEYRQVRRLSIETPHQQPLNLDGEPAGATPLRAEVLPGALQVLA